MMAAGDSGIPVCPGSCRGGQRNAIALKPPKADVPPVGNRRSCLIVAVTLHFEMVVSAGEVAHLQRVGILSSLGEFSISHISGLTCTGNLLLALHCNRN